MVDWRAADLTSPFEYFVFDDFPVSRISSFYKQFMGCQKEFTVTDKYLSKITLRPGSTPSVFLFNTPEFNLLHTVCDWDFVINNCIVIEVDKLF